MSSAKIATIFSRGRWVKEGQQYHKRKIYEFGGEKWKNIMYVNRWIKMRYIAILSMGIS